MNQNKPEWVKEFREIFVTDDGIVRGFHYKALESWISNLIEKTREETFNEIFINMQYATDKEWETVQNSLFEYAKSKGINLTPEVEGE